MTTEIISTLYGDNLGYPQLEISDKVLPQVVGMVGRLELWWDNVHPSVRWRPASHDRFENASNPSKILLMRSMLKLDFLNAQLLLYRPVVFLASKLKLSAEDEEHTVFPKMMTICVRKCFKAAQLLISTVHNLQNSSGPWAGAPWLSLYHSNSSSFCPSYVIS